MSTEDAIKQGLKESAEGKATVDLGSFQKYLTLADLAVGDEVVLLPRTGHYHSRDEIKKIDRVTPTTIVIGHQVFYKRDGYERTSDRWRQRIRTIVDDADRKTVQDKLDQARLSELLDRVVWSKLPVETLRAVNSILRP